MRFKCLAHEQNTIFPDRARTRTTRSGDESNNNEASTLEGRGNFYQYKRSEERLFSNTIKHEKIIRWKELSIEAMKFTMENNRLLFTTSNRTRTRGITFRLIPRSLYLLTPIIPTTKSDSYAINCMSKVLQISFIVHSPYPSRRIERLVSLINSIRSVIFFEATEQNLQVEILIWSGPLALTDKLIPLIMDAYIMS